jgi:signal transduction histidine kinase
MDLFQHEQRIRDIERLNFLHSLDLLDSPAEPAYDRLTKLASHIFGVPISLVSLVDADRQYFKSFVGLNGQEAETRQTSLEYSFCQYAVSSQEPLIVNDASQHPILKESLGFKELDVVAYAGIPLVTSNGVALGAFCIVENKPREWKPEEIVILQDLAQAVMTEIELRHEIVVRQKAEEELKRQFDLMSSVLAVNHALGETLDVDYILRVGLENALRLAQVEHGFLALMQDDVLRLAESAGPYSEADLNQNLESDTGIIARVVRTHLPEWIEDVASDPDYVPFLPDTRSKILIPMMSRGNMIGLLNLESQRNDKFSGELVNFLILLVSRIAVAVDNSHLLDALQRQLEEMRQANEQLQHLEQLKTDMIRIAAHDLRNPISIINGYVHLIQRTTSPATQEEVAPLIAPIAEAAARMQAITSDVLSLQRVEALARDSAVQVDLVAIVRKAFTGLEKVAHDKPLAFTLNAPDTKIDVQAEGAYLTEAVANLINNAIKYTPEGGAVEVSVCERDGQAVFEVKDTGVGIPEGEQKRLFQPFARVRTQETEDVEGTGLGLYLVKRVVERFDGHMRFSSVYRQGSTFGFDLPLVQLA